MMPLYLVIIFGSVAYVMSCFFNAMMLTECFGCQFTKFWQRLLILIPFITIPLVIAIALIGTLIVFIGFIFGGLIWIFVGTKTWKKIDQSLEAPIDWLYHLEEHMKKILQ